MRRLVPELHSEKAGCGTTIVREGWIMRSEPDTIEATSLQPNSLLATDVYCLGCDYNLRTLSPTALCPECATPVRTSLINPGDLIWLRKVRRGISLIMPVYLFILLSTVGVSLVVGHIVGNTLLPGMHTPMAVGRAAFSLIALIGIISLTLPGRRPPGTPAQPTLRRVIWILAVLFWLLVLGSWIETIRLRSSAKASTQVLTLFVLGGVWHAISYGLDMCIILYLGRLVSCWQRSLKWLTVVIAAIVGAIMLWMAAVDVLRYTLVRGVFAGTKTPLAWSLTSLINSTVIACDLIAPIVCLVYLRRCRALLTRVIANRRAEIDAPVDTPHSTSPQAIAVPGLASPPETDDSAGLPLR